MMSIVIGKLVLYLYLCTAACHGLRREYFLAIEEIVWEYSTPDEDRKDLEKDDTRILKYTKAVYRQYTDGSFKIKSPRAKYLGLIGPILRAEVKDTFVVHTLNRASRRYSFHPHGVFYTKSSEGALYNDNTTSSDKEDDGISPGGSHTYIWEVRDEYGPGPDDPNCLSWAYHSHVYSSKDQDSGLVGTLLTCRQGTLTKGGLRTDVDREFAVIMFDIEESNSWYFEDNIRHFSGNPQAVDRDNQLFIESNKFQTMNGKTWAVLQGLDMCLGDLVHWHLITMGTEQHSVQFVGNTVILNGHRLDNLQLMPGTFKTAIMRADNPGWWVLGCHLTTHTKAGMFAGFTVHDTCKATMGNHDPEERTKLDGIVRKHYIAAEEVEWNYAPSGINFITQKPIDDEGQPSTKYFKKGPDRIGGTYIKALYRAYADETFQVKLEHDPALGTLGPLLAAEIGDTFEINFKNMAKNITSNIEPHGVLSEGVPGPIEPGGTHKYIWRVPEAVSPTNMDKNCIPYLYSSLANFQLDQNAGLVGPMLICRKGTLDDELAKRIPFIYLELFDENLSNFLKENVNKFAGDPTAVDFDDKEFKESNRMRTVNGFAFGNYMELEFCAREYNDVYLATAAGGLSVHSFLFDGGLSRARTVYSGITGVLPHYTAIVSVRPYEEGSGTYGCRVINHGLRGMRAFYKSIDCGAPPSNFIPTAKRTFYIGAVEEVWDYLPNRTDLRGDSVDNLEHVAYLISRQENGKLIGTKYKKAIYYEYTDDTFTVRKPKPRHFGFLGPLLEMEIGDEVQIVFKNMATRPYNIKTLGLYEVGSMEFETKVAQPGETVTYKWEVRPEISPMENQPDCFGMKYFSLADYKDMHTGLNGPILVCKRGSLRKAGGANENFYLLFMITDENRSHYLDDNIRQFANADPDTFDKRDGDFIHSNKISHVNGFMYHIPGLIMHKGDLVMWHLFSEGEEDVHPIHFHANALVYESDEENRIDVFDLYPGQESTVLMRPDAVGNWQFHCHVNTHVDEGMTGIYTVLDSRVVCKSSCAPYDCEPGTHIDCTFLGIKRSGDLLNGLSQIRVLSAIDKDMLVPADQVTHLDLSHNELHDSDELRRLLFEFPKLYFLKIESVGLTELRSDLFENNLSLRILYLRNNKIQRLEDDVVNGAMNLTVIDLRHNDLREYPLKILVGRKSHLKRLDLRGNKHLQPPCMNALHVDAVSTGFCLSQAESPTSGIK